MHKFIPFCLITFKNHTGNSLAGYFAGRFRDKFKYFRRKKFDKKLLTGHVRIFKFWLEIGFASSTCFGWNHWGSMSLAARIKWKTHSKCLWLFFPKISWFAIRKMRKRHRFQVFEYFSFRFHHFIVFRLPFSLNFTNNIHKCRARTDLNQTVSSDDQTILHNIIVLWDVEAKGGINKNSKPKFLPESF